MINNDSTSLVPYSKPESTALVTQVNGTSLVVSTAHELMLGAFYGVGNPGEIIRTNPQAAYHLAFLAYYKLDIIENPFVKGREHTSTQEGIRRTYPNLINYLNKDLSLLEVEELFGSSLRSVEEQKRNSNIQGQPSLKVIDGVIEKAERNAENKGKIENVGYQSVRGRIEAVKNTLRRNPRIKESQINTTEIALKLLIDEGEFEGRNGINLAEIKSSRFLFESMLDKLEENNNRGLVEVGIEEERNFIDLIHRIARMEALTNATFIGIDMFERPKHENERDHFQGLINQIVVFYQCIEAIKAGSKSAPGLEKEYSQAITGIINHLYQTNPSLYVELKNRHLKGAMGMTDIGHIEEWIEYNTTNVGMTIPRIRPDR